MTLRACDLACIFFCNDTATTEIYTLSLHDALPIYLGLDLLAHRPAQEIGRAQAVAGEHLGRLHHLLLVDEDAVSLLQRSEEHTSELQSRQYLVCRLLLEQKTIE